ncbi:MAG: hypothetical protein P4N60_12345 [Verrucomicrobiae bacterium]|nr:hypothetical protein [Verrucomicrobiae bacterium]
MNTALADDLAALTDTNGNFTWPPVLPAAQIGGYTNIGISGVNNSNGAFFKLTANGHFKFRDEYGTTNDFTTNGLAITQTNGNSFVYSNGTMKLNGLSVATINQLIDTNTVLNSLNQVTSNFLATNALGLLNLQSNLWVKGSNYLATNFSAALLSISNNLATNALSITSITSNGLSYIWNYNLNSASNGLQQQLISVQLYAAGLSNLVASVSNNIVGTSNAQNAALLVVSNLVTGSKAFSLTLPATYATIGAAFSAPYMPDGNYSVGVLPQDATTASIIGGGLDTPWADTKAASGFNLRIPFPTNSDLHFDIFLKENTQ